MVVEGGNLSVRFHWPFDHDFAGQDERAGRESSRIGLVFLEDQYEEWL